MDTQKEVVFGAAINLRPPLFTVGGGVAIAGAAETAITVVDALQFGYLLTLNAICTVQGTTGGTFTLRDGAAGTTLLVLQQPLAPAPLGTSLCWIFPHPWKTNAINKAFTIQHSVATLGTWVWYANGHRSTT